MNNKLREKSTQKVLRNYTAAKNALLSRKGSKYDLWADLLTSLQKDIISLTESFEEREAYIQEQNLSDDYVVLDHLSGQVEKSLQFIDAAVQSKDLGRQRNALRVMLQEFSFLRGSLSWSSASYAQSSCPMFFLPSENDPNSINYDRYGSLYLLEREKELGEALGANPKATDLLLTSSGQAAFSVIESFLFKEALPDNPCIVSMPYLYFEGLEQLSLTKNTSFFRASSWSSRSIANLAAKKNADVIFIDPLANLGQLPSIDLKEFARELGDDDWSKRWLVIDGTLISGGIKAFEIFNRPNHPKVLYYESGSKYLQLGLDLQMVGVIVCPKGLIGSLSNHRRNTGGVMYHHSLTRFPRFSRQQFLTRMKRITKNAEFFFSSLMLNKKLSNKLSLAFPSEWKDLGWSHGGGLVAATMKETSLNKKKNYDQIIAEIINRCKNKGLPFTRGTSFGFSAFRVAAITEVPGEIPPFLRFSVGDGDLKETAQISDIVANVFCNFFEEIEAENGPSSREDQETARLLKEKNIKKNVHVPNKNISFRLG